MSTHDVNVLRRIKMMRYSFYINVIEFIYIYIYIYIKRERERERERLKK